MFTTTLLTAPDTHRLDAALVDSLRNAWGGSDARWLAVDEAAEFDMPAIPDTRWDVWDEMQKIGVDLIVQPSAGRRKKLLLADMDSTMIQQECIDELADMAGVGDRVKAITARAMNGELDFDGALRERVGLLKGLEAGIIDRVVADRITYTPGGHVLLATMKAHGARTALVSGGFTAFTARVAAELGFDSHQANTLVISDGVLAGTVTDPILGREAKVDALERLVAEMGISAADVLAVGDGANDLGMLGRAGAGVALHAKPAVAAQCDIRITFGDLTALLYLQGYTRAEFVMP